MNHFFDIKLSDGLRNFVFSYANGDPSSLVILDDGWSPAVGTYNEHDQAVINDVVEELDCMTNVATRDEALFIIHNLNDIIHYAKRIIEEKFEYKVVFYIKSQFSSQPVSRSYVVGPPDDGNVIQLSTELMTSPPGQIKFKLRFKRQGFWILDTFYNQQNEELNADYYGFRGLWVSSITLPTDIKAPNPFYYIINFKADSDYDLPIERLFMCVNTYSWTNVKTFNWSASFNMTSIPYNSNLLAQGNTGYSIQDSTDTDEERPYADVNLSEGTYAVFVFWRSVQSNVPHLLQVQFSTGAETQSALLLSSNTSPKLTYLGTVTTSAYANKLYLKIKIGHSSGFEIEKIVLVRLKKLSRIIEINNVLRPQGTSLYVSNLLEKSLKTLYFYSSDLGSKLVPTYNSLNVVADSKNFKMAFIGHSPGVFSLKNTNFQHVYRIDATIYYKNIRTTFH